MRAADGVPVRGRHGSRSRDRLVVLCHPALTGQYYPPLTELAELVFERYDVATFDFRGHGGSGGTCTLDPMGPAHDLRTVVDHFRGRDYTRVGAAGFSLGGMAAIASAARFGNLDAVVSIGAPPRLPDFSSLVRHPHLSRLTLSLLGARMRADGYPIFSTREMVPHVAPAPILLVHSEHEFTFPRSGFELMWEAAGHPKSRMELAGAGHAQLGEHAPEILRWLSELPF